MLPCLLIGKLSGAEKIIAAGMLVGLPVFFSAMVFSLSLRDVGNPAHALGVNLLGAVIGGVLENTVMIGGTPILGVLAILLYRASAALVSFPPGFFGWNFPRGRSTARSEMPAAHPYAN